MTSFQLTHAITYYQQHFYITLHPTWHRFFKINEHFSFIFISLDQSIHFDFVRLLLLNSLLIKTLLDILVCNLKYFLESILKCNGVVQERIAFNANQNFKKKNPSCQRVFSLHTKMPHNRK